MVMQLDKRLGRLCCVALVAFGVTGTAGATSANTDVSDIWANPGESGWGMQLVNTGTFVFATIYVYAPGGLPTWMTGELTRAAGPMVTYSGPLFVTTGPYFGGAFDPKAVTRRQAGTMTFVLTTVTTGQLTYSVDGVVVDKAVQRQELTFDTYAGEYVAIATETVTGCSDPASNGTTTSTVNLSVTQDNRSLQMVSTYANGSSCSYHGAYSQLGRMGQTSGTYDCSWGETGTVTLFEMSNVPYMFTARLDAQSSNFGCATAAEYAAVIPR
jgi:hypothetical protein